MTNEPSLHRRIIQAFLAMAVFISLALAGDSVAHDAFAVAFFLVLAVILSISLLLEI